MLNETRVKVTRIESASQIEEIKRLKEHIRAAGGKCHIAMHPFFYDRTVNEKTDKNIEEWITGKKESHIPMIIMEDELQIRTTEKLIKNLRPNRQVYLIPTYNTGGTLNPKPTTTVGSWNLFDKLGIEKAFIGGRMLIYSHPVREEDYRKSEGYETNPGYLELLRSHQKVAKTREKILLAKRKKQPELFDEWAAAQQLDKIACVGEAYKQLAAKFSTIILPEVCSPDKYARDALRKFRNVK